MREDVFGDVFELLNQDDALAASSPRRLANKEEFRVQFHVLLQGLALLGYQKGDRGEVKQLWEGAPHPIVYHAELLLAAQELQPRESVVVHFLLHHNFDVFVDETEAEPVEFAAHCDFCEARHLNYGLQSLQLAPTVRSVDREGVFVQTTSLLLGAAHRTTLLLHWACRGRLV